MRKITLLFLLVIPLFSQAKIWQVGLTRTYKVPSAVSSLVSDGDTVQIDAGVYNDCAIWNNNNLLLQGLGGYAHMENSVCGLKGIWNIENSANNIILENLEFSGASITGANGGNAAGLRAQGGSFTINHCYFHNNQNGILCNPVAGNTAADVLIKYSVFAYNGCANGDPSGCSPGYEHNMYIGSGYRSFTIMYSYSHGAIQGHNIKTRANTNYILYNSVMDLADGTSSYDIDLAQGGPTVIMGNLIEGGPNKANHTAVISYNEGSTNPGPLNLYLVSNTLVSDLSSLNGFITVPVGSDDTLTIINNLFAGPGTLIAGTQGFSKLDSATNWFAKTIADAGLVNAAAYNYNLSSSSLAINKGSNAGVINSIYPSPHFSLTPVSEYIDSANTQTRTTNGGKIDIGAYEYSIGTGIADYSDRAFNVLIYQNPGNREIVVHLINPDNNEKANARMYNGSGQLIGRQNINQGNDWRINTSGLSAGVYIVRTQSGEMHCSNKFVIY